MIRRREFIAGLGGAAAWPLTARAQQRALPVIGYLSGRARDTDASLLVSVRRGLADVGYAEGRNVTIEYRFADGRYKRPLGCYTRPPNSTLSLPFPGMTNTLYTIGPLIKVSERGHQPSHWPRPHDPLH